MADKNSIFYRPNIEPDLHYDTAGELAHYATPVTETPETPDIHRDRVTNTTEYAEGLLGMTEVLPEDTGEVLMEILTPVVETLKKITDPEDVHYDPHEPESEEPTPSVPDFKQDLTPEEAKMIAELAEDKVDIELEVQNQQPLYKLVASVYKVDLYDIREYFVNKLGLVMQAFMQEMIILKNECSLPAIDDLLKDYDGDQVAAAGANTKHLHDTIVRSQIVRRQKARLFKKTHGTDETLLWMRQCQAAADQRTRYYKENYLEEDEFLNLQSNTLLLEARMQYDENYQRAISGLYKYLNSAVIIVDDMLKMQLNEARAKAKLYSDGINIFATAPVAQITTGSETAATASKAASTSVTDKIANAVKTSRFSSSTATK